MTDDSTKAPRGRAPAGLLAAVVLGVAALVGFVYRDAVAANFFNDDFHWLFGARRFEWANLVRLDRYDHFYRPVIEIYFYLAQRVFQCDPLPFHLLSLGIHLCNTLLLFGLGRALTGSATTAAAAALLFTAQPGYVEAVVWVAAITDLLAATWFLLTLLLHAMYLQHRAWWWRAATFASFGVSLGTHESAVTILPMMVALDALADWPGRLDRVMPWARRRVAIHAPFAVALVAFLAVAYVVNSRNYVVREGYYVFGWHAVPNILDYVAGLYVGRRRVTWHIGVVLVMAALAWRGTPRMRFALTWMVVTLLPVSFFTWGGASRYLYVPAAGFALLLADLLGAGRVLAARRLAPRTADAVAAVALGVLVVRFALFAVDGVADFRRLTTPYDRFMAAARGAAQGATSPSEVRVTPADLEGIPALYRDAAAETALCAAGVRVTVVQ